MPWLLLALHAKEDPVPLPCDGDASIGQGSPDPQSTPQSSKWLEIISGCFG